MIRVLHFVHRVPPEYSGAAYQALKLVRTLDGLEGGERIENHLVAYSSQPEAACPPEDVPTQVVGLRRGPLGKLRQYGELQRAFARVAPDVVHVHGYHRPAVLLGRWSGAPTVLKTTMLDVDDVDAIRSKGPLDRLAVDGVQRMVSMTPAIAAHNDAGPGGVLIPNGVDLAAFHPRSCAPEEARELRASVGAGEDDILLLFVGGDSERKGFAALPPFWRALRRRLGERAQLLCCGRYKEAGSAAWLEHSAGPGVILRPELLDLSRWLPAADVLLFPSEQEGLPNAVLEAAATDTLVLARNLPGTYDGVLGDGNSLLVEELDARAVDQLAAALEAGAHLRVDNGDFRERFSLESVATRYRDLYTSLAGRAA